MAIASISTIKKLFLRTGNRCAFPECDKQLIDDSGTLIAEICHICADSPGGPRYDAIQTDEERQAYSNLIVLCANHHKTIDGDEVRYTAGVLREMKRRHELKQDRKFVISDRVATKVAWLATGVAIAPGVWELLSELRGFGKELFDALGLTERKENSSGRSSDALRYGPRGTLYFFSFDQEVMRIGEFFGEIFRNFGWRTFGLSEPPQEHLSRLLDEHHLLMLFMIKDPHQIQNASQMIDEFFRRLGFVPIDRAGNYQESRPDENGLRICLLVGRQR